jgi:7,8-dihydro-6-hydroxymethylpterin-pyrophosphokinase
MTQRKFVLIPLLEIAPELVDPTSGVPMKQLLDRLPAEQRIRILE